jgi:hypothetical protein
MNSIAGLMEGMGGMDTNAFKSSYIMPIQKSVDTATAMANGFNHMDGLESQNGTVIRGAADGTLTMKEIEHTASLDGTTTSISKQDLDKAKALTQPAPQADKAPKDYMQMMVQLMDMMMKLFSSLYQK